jgi:2-hydroxy-3-keto-5-methylthiopentenyl-1-phosphate phosphatase
VANWDTTVVETLVLCDFDGTITPLDAFYVLLERYADPSFRDLLDAFEERQIDSRVFMERSYPLLQAPLDELNHCLDTIEIDPSFSRLVDFCQERGLDLWIASDGMNWWINRILRNNGFSSIPILSNQVTFTTAGPRYAYPWRDAGCETCQGMFGLCKRRVIKELRRYAQTIVFVGDGSSDACVIGEADLIFAKNTLAKYCESLGQEFMPYVDFNDVVTYLKRNL